MKIPIRARNNLKIPVRITIHATDEILLTIGSEGASLKDYYRVCVDRDMKPSNSWESIGDLKVESKISVEVEGAGEETNNP